MKVGIPKEVLPGETRVAVIPETVKRLAEKGLEVTLEAGAGALAGFSDAEYQAAGAKIGTAHAALLGDSDLLLKVQRPADGKNGLPDEIAALKQGSSVIGLLQPFAQREGIERLAERRITSLSMEMIPRITRAQNMDALSSMATVSGYKAVLLAANAFTRFFPMFMTAAGTVSPARVLVLGAGVAGLQAIATARRLGAVVEAFDTRPVVKDQVESLGAKFISLPITKEEAEGSGGYAKALSEEQHRKELELISSRLVRSDIVITTAQIPGRKAPVLITGAMVQGLKAGSIIVDLAAEGGGNCELTEPNKTVVKNGVTIIGTFNLPALMPTHASQLYSKNVGNLVLHLVGKEGYKIDLADPITGAIVLTHLGQVVHPALKAA